MSADDTLVVHEIYRSIQGESTFVGVPCTFVRLTGCNLRCTWCDTPHAFHGGKRMQLEEVRREVFGWNTPLVELTGGEPLLQAAALPLMHDFCDAGKTVLVETSGERDISGIDSRVHRIVDFKAPGSGESGRNRWSNLEYLTHRDEVKFVLKDRTDYEWAREITLRERLESRVHAVLLSPVFERLDPRDLVQWMLEDALPARIHLQIHKYIWSPETTGV